MNAGKTNKSTTTERKAAAILFTPIVRWVPSCCCRWRRPPMQKYTEKNEASEHSTTAKQLM
jgi:hypothetical protein